MTPAARLSAAIEVLDRILAAQNAESALTSWGRAARFAGSGDRAAVRDLVFAALRCKRSFAALGGGQTGRGLVLGGLRAGGITEAGIADLFSGQGHAPHAIGPADQPRTPSQAEAWDMPDWLISEMQRTLTADMQGDANAADAADIMQALRARAPVYLRVNPSRTTMGAAVAELAAGGVETVFVQNMKFCLQAIKNERKIQNMPAYLEGRIEFQDASSQAVIEALEMPQAGKILDYCAGGGGKTLSLAAQTYDNKAVSVYAYDAAARRMADLPARAARAGAVIEITENPENAAPYDLILTDVPCSGSGSWRRDPQGKWALSAARLDELVQIQAQIMDATLPLLAAGGVLAYSTCSVLPRENETQIAAFLQRHPQFALRKMQRFGLAAAPKTDVPRDQATAKAAVGDGFFLAVLQARP